MDVDAELEQIKLRIKRFRQQKEDELISQSSQQLQSNKLHSIDRDILKNANKPFLRFASKEDLIRILDIDCILTPYIPLRGGEWPNALIANYTEKCADLGSVDSHGSLWRFVRKDIGIQGTFVVLESGEIGEKSLYLTSGLALTTDITNAAIWTIKLQYISSKDNTTSILKPTTAFGSLIQLVLVARKLDGRMDITCLDNAFYATQKCLVAAKCSGGSGDNGVALLTESERAISQDTFNWSLTWQVTREDNVIDGFSFLDSIDLDFQV
jgi:hypothetical protein